MTKESNKSHWYGMYELERSKTKDLEEKVAFYKAREVELGWTRPDDLKLNEFVELMYFLDDVCKEDKELYERATSEVNKNFDRMSVARCTTYEMLFRRMYIQAFREGGDKLTEAKEIISSMLNAMRRLGAYRTQGGIMDKAKAFLKE